MERFARERITTPVARMSSTVTPRRPLTETNQRPIVHCGSENDRAMSVQETIACKSFSSGQQMAMALVKVLFTEQELASCTLTGRTIHGQARVALDGSRLQLIESLMQQKFQMSDGELAAARSTFRQALANRCKYLRLKLAPHDRTLL